MTRRPSSLGETPDDDLVRLIRAGDRDAAEVLLRRHHTMVATICRRVVGTRGDAEDATQIALVTAIERLDRFDGRAAFTTWLYRVTTNVCLDELRRAGRRDRPTDAGEVGAELSAASPRQVEPDPASRISARVDIDAALAAIPEEFRLPVVLRDLCGLDYAEIAATLDLPAGTVRSRISRGRRDLLVLLGNPVATTERPNPLT